MTDIQQVEIQVDETQQVENTELNAQAENIENGKLTNNKDIIAYLAEKFPLCFSLEGEANPLKIGLFQDLAEALKDDEKVSKTQLRQALRQYTSNWRYLHGCRLGAERVDLNGNPVGVLDQEQADHAAQQLAEAKAKFAEKKAAERAVNPKNNKKRPATNKPAVKGKKPFVKKSSPKAEKIELATFDFTQAKEGVNVKVKVGEQAKSAVILEVVREGARVQLDNGLVISVTKDRLFL